MWFGGSSMDYARSPLSCFADAGDSSSSYFSHSNSAAGPVNQRLSIVERPGGGSTPKPWVTRLEKLYWQVISTTEMICSSLNPIVRSFSMSACTTSSGCRVSFTA